MTDPPPADPPTGLATRLLAENLVPLSDICRRLPPGAGGRPTHAATVHRWVRRGVGGVHLEAVRLGGRWVTSDEALARFVAARTGAAGRPATAPARGRSTRDGPASRRRRALTGVSTPRTVGRIVWRN